MPRNYLIALGGTGSRCLEAVVYLAAAGLFRDPLHVLIIDPDQNNGNSVKTRQLMSGYHALQLAQQPERAQGRRVMGLMAAGLPEPTLFRATINRQPGGGNAQQSIFWHNPNSAQRKFAEVIEYQAQPENLKRFLDLFYESEDLNMELDVGYRGRTNVGAVALKQDLEGTVTEADSGLREFLTNLDIDLQAGEARVFIMGSVFGGTGAAGLPTVPSLIRNLASDVIAQDNRSRLRYGCVMMTPYFSFPQGSRRDGGPGTDSSRHAVATQAALLHYAHVPPGYQHVYFIGAPNRSQTNLNNAIGGQNQINDPHYAELVAALAALDFFNVDLIANQTRQLHFADTVQQGRDAGVTWQSLPVHPDFGIRREEIKRKLVALTTLTFFFKNFLYHGFANRRSYKETNWYRNNFGQLTLDDQGPLLRTFYDFSNSYLSWLHKLGAAGQQVNLELFDWNALMADDRELCAQFVGNLATGMQTRPKFINQGYDRILEKLDALKLSQPSTDSAMGLFVYLLHHAVVGFCKENYSWQNAEASVGAGRRL